MTQALLLGLRGGVPPAVTEAFRRSGTAHLLAISGLHVSIVLALAIAVSRSLLGRRRGLYLLGPFLLIWAYALLAGATPSVVRASLMGTAYLLALATGRGANPLNALAVAALLMLVLQPRWLWHLSFQLSFAAMAGILLVGQPAWAYSLRTWWPQGAKSVLARILSWAVGGMLISAGAVLATLPLVTFNFHQVPLFGIPATLLMLLAVPPLLVGGFLAGAAEMAWTPLGLAVAWLPALLADYLIVVARTASAVPWGVVRVPEIGVQLVWAYYLILLGILAVVYRRRWLPSALEGARALWSGRSLTSRHRVMVVLALLPLVVAPWALGLARSDHQMHLYFLDVGQGDASLIRTPGGFNILIDGGPDEAITVAAVDRLLPRSDRTIDDAFLSHPDADHFQELMGLARRGRLRMVVVPPVVEGEGGLWRRQLESTGVRVVDGEAGVSMAFPDGVRLRVLHPPLPPLEGTSADVNNNSLVVEVSFRNASVLYPGDIEAEGEWVLLDSGARLSAQVLKLAHHGSDTSSTTELLRAVAPAIVVVSVAEDNPYGHPSPELLERASQLLPAHRLYSTALQGTIYMTTDGERWWARTSR